MSGVFRVPAGGIDGVKHQRLFLVSFSRHGYMFDFEP